MPQKSSIQTRLTPPQREKLNAWIGQDAPTLEELMKLCEDEFNVTISQTAMHRHRKKVDRIAEKYRQSREMAEVLADKMGDEFTSSEFGGTLVKLLRSLVFDFMSTQMDEEKEIDPAQFMFLAKAIKDAAGAMRLDQDHEKKRQEEANKKARSEAAEAAGEKMAEAGLSADQIQFWREDFLGVRKPKAGDTKE
ncbi:MAG: DUF3486 family protein [Rhodospirillales bacterium]